MVPGGKHWICEAEPAQEPSIPLEPTLKQVLLQTSEMTIIGSDTMDGHHGQELKKL